MSISDKELKIIKRLEEIRLLSNGIEEIEEYEELVMEIQECENIETIPYLCSIMEDEAQCSAVEGVLETILILIINSPDKTAAMNKVIEGTLKMSGHGDSWKRILHTEILRQTTFFNEYVEAVKSTEAEARTEIVSILQQIKKNGTVKNVDLADMIQKIEA